MSSLEPGAEETLPPRPRLFPRPRLRLRPIVRLDRPSLAPARRVVDCVGMTLMTGLVDSHVHVTASSANLRMPSGCPRAYCAASGPSSTPCSTAGSRPSATAAARTTLAAALDEHPEGPAYLLRQGALADGWPRHSDEGDATLPSGACECCNRTIGRVRRRGRVPSR